MAIETPEYKIISKHEGCEFRRYSDMVIAKKIQADYKVSTSSGFRRITSYIFSGNNKVMKIAMTSAVIAVCPQYSTVTVEYNYL
ncbi:heme-binding protein [Candidatus Thioglobus sp.]|nr:heme-binding protein [Candidatus Thioglobus sp.]